MEELVLMNSEVNMLVEAVEQYIHYLLEDIDCYLTYCEGCDPSSSTFETSKKSAGELIEKAKEFITLANHINVNKNITQGYLKELADIEDFFKTLR